MKKIDTKGLKLCKIQAELFKNSIEECKSSSAIFLRRFMYSDLAKRMDKESFLFESDHLTNLYLEISEEYGETSYGSQKYGPEELYWIGYIYRYWAYTYQLSSQEIYKIIKPGELRKLYFPYHSLDPKAVILRILEAKSMKEENLLEKGVRILREMRKNNSSASR